MVPKKWQMRLMSTVLIKDPHTDLGIEAMAFHMISKCLRIGQSTMNTWKPRNLGLHWPSRVAGIGLPGPAATRKHKNVCVGRGKPAPHSGRTMTIRHNWPHGVKAQLPLTCPSLLLSHPLPPAASEASCTDRCYIPTMTHSTYNGLNSSRRGPKYPPPTSCPNPAAHSLASMVADLLPWFSTRQLLRGPAPSPCKMRGK